MPGALTVLPFFRLAGEVIVRFAGLPVRGPAIGRPLPSWRVS